MRILLSIHMYPPSHLCGAEFFAHNIAKAMIKRGHQVRVLLHYKEGLTSDYTFEGVDVYLVNKANYKALFEWSQVVMTHLDISYWTFEFAAKMKKPCVFMAHNTFSYDCVNSTFKGRYVIYNSQHSKDELNYPNPGFVLPPPCDYRHYDVGGDPFKRKYITLINHNANKGGDVLVEIAKLMPKVKFLAVQGSYYEQVYSEEKNITYLPKQVDIREVYKQTRLLIMPSDYESWGMTATEAMCNGIPVLANFTDGLMENLDYAGTYASRKAPEKWVEAIKRFDDKEYYGKKSELSRKRSRELDPEKKLNELEQWLLQIAYKLI